MTRTQEVLEGAPSAPPAPKPKRDPVIDLGCLGLMSLPAAFFVFFGMTVEGSRRVSLAYLAGLATVFVGVTLYNRRHPYSKASSRFARDEVDRIRRAMSENAAALHLLSPQQFEDAMAELFTRMGHTVERTPYSNDGGKDLVVRRGDLTVFIELKRYAVDKKVGRPALMKLHSALTHERADAAICLTTSSFTEPAREFAGLNRIRLIDGDELSLMMREAYPTPDDPTILRGMCRVCGDIVEFGLSEKTARACRAGHAVPHPIPRTILHRKRPVCPECGVQVVRTKLGKRRHYAWRCPSCGKTCLQPDWTTTGAAEPQGDREAADPTVPSPPMGDLVGAPNDAFPSEGSGQLVGLDHPPREEGRGFPDSSMVEVSLESSMVRSAGYDRSRQILYLRFHGGAMYKYHEVPEDVFSGLLHAESHGRFASQIIIPRFRGEAC